MREAPSWGGGDDQRRYPADALRTSLALQAHREASDYYYHNPLEVLSVKPFPQCPVLTAWETRSLPQPPPSQSSSFPLCLTPLTPAWPQDMSVTQCHPPHTSQFHAPESPEGRMRLSWQET